MQGKIRRYVFVSAGTSCPINLGYSWQRRAVLAAGAEWMGLFFLRLQSFLTCQSCISSL